MERLTQFVLGFHVRFIYRSYQNPLHRVYIGYICLQPDTRLRTLKTLWDSEEELNGPSVILLPQRRRVDRRRFCW